MSKSNSLSGQQPVFKIKLRTGILALDKPVVMGILNLTADSFYDGGRYISEKAYLNQAEKMLMEGAAVIDIGAVSTRPGAKEVTEEEEWRNLKPALISLIRQFPQAVFSADTFRAKIAGMAVNEGVQMVNDISGGTFDSRMFETIGRLRVPYIMMHIKGTPQTMQINPVYDNVIAEVKDYFKSQLKKLAGFGITDNIILDPGFGFGKTVEHNYQLLKGLASFGELGFPVLAGISRKSMINKILDTTPNEALNGTTFLNTIALLNGASILRVHDVKEAVQAIRLYEYYMKTEYPS